MENRFNADQAGPDQASNDRLDQDGEAVLVHVLNLVVLRRKNIRQD
jgi:hypothetical protein